MSVKLDSVVPGSQPVSLRLWHTATCYNGPELYRGRCRNKLLSDVGASSELSDNLAGMKAAPFQLEGSDPADTIGVVGDEQIIAVRRIRPHWRTGLVKIDDKS